MGTMAEVMNYGNPDLPAGTPERPVVTLALLLYNQEAFARESITGALSQTYEPLEVIISDDCSSDKTWEAIRIAAESYDGPHKIVARRNCFNLGPYSHVLEIASISSGKLIVLSAGDDISKPERVSMLCSAWLATGAWGLDSNYDIIDQSGRITIENTFSSDLRSANSEFQRYFYGSSIPVEVVHGATSAYDKRLFNYVPSSSMPILSEDGVLTFMLHALGKPVAHLPCSLVYYRRHRAAVSNMDTKSCSSYQDFLELLEKDRRYALNLRNRSLLFLDFVGRGSCGNAKANIDEIRRTLLIAELRSEWASVSITRKLKGLLMASNQKKLGYLMPVILGSRFAALYLFIKNRLGSCLRALLPKRLLAKT